MPRTRRRFAVLATVGVLGIPLAVVATAFACANLATIKLDHAGATPGTQVSFVGRNFNSNAAASPVAVRWNSRNGEVLFQGRAVAGKVRGTFTVPNAKPGYYIVVATQTGPNGRIASGTPGRAPLKIRASSTRSRSTVVAPLPSPAGGPPSPDALAVGLALSAFMLLGGLGAMAVRRRRDLPALSPTV